MYLSERIAYLDRRVSSPAASYSAGTDTTTWTLPYDIALDGTEGELQVCLTDTEVALTPTRPALNQVAVSGEGDLSSRPVVIGVLYDMLYVPTVPAYRDRTGKIVTTGDLLIRRATVRYNEAAHVAVSVMRKGRRGILAEHTDSGTGQGEVKMPVNQMRPSVRLSISDRSASSCAIAGLVWTGDFLTRARTV
jgi:hypothetical protein